MRAIVAIAALALASGAAAQMPIRGSTPIPEINSSDTYRMEKHDRSLPRSHRWQPPLIPHNIKGYQITKNVNTCMVCHSSKAAPNTGATPVGKSHYLDRDGKEHPNISTRRNVSHTSPPSRDVADPLVDSTFKGPGQ